jgi:hypothetical protein
MVKTMSTDGGHLGWSFGSLDIILKVDHLRTIHAMFALNWLTDFSWMVIYKIFVFCADRKSNMAARAHVF